MTTFYFSILHGIQQGFQQGFHDTVSEGLVDRASTLTRKTRSKNPTFSSLLLFSFVVEINRLFLWKIAIMNLVLNHEADHVPDEDRQLGCLFDLNKFFLFSSCLCLFDFSSH